MPDKCKRCEATVAAGTYDMTLYIKDCRKDYDDELNPLEIEVEHGPCLSPDQVETEDEGDMTYQVLAGHDNQARIESLLDAMNEVTTLGLNDLQGCSYEVKITVTLK